MEKSEKKMKGKKKRKEGIKNKNNFEAGQSLMATALSDFFFFVFVLSIPGQESRHESACDQ